MEEIKLITGELCQALLENINSKMVSISFDLFGKDCIRLRFILEKITPDEEELIEDAVSEFGAMHVPLEDFILEKFLLSEEVKPLDNEVYRKYGFKPIPS